MQQHILPTLKADNSILVPSILVVNVQLLENKLDDLRARVTFQWDMKDCTILCLTETWLTPTVPDRAVTHRTSINRTHSQCSAWTEWQSQTKQKVNECVSWSSPSGAMLGAFLLSPAALRLIWNT